jgi:hypothetical protein
MHTMTTDTRCVGLDTLFAEIARYLAVVDVFREQGCEPRWSVFEPEPWAQTRLVDATGPA